MSGLVSDPARAVIPGASVEIVNQQTQETLHAKTNGAGLYNAPAVRPGHYTVTISASGFETERVQNLVVEVAGKVSLDYVLHPGAVSQAVNVDGSGIHINTTDATVSTVIDRQFVENMPLNGRSFQSLLTLVPGVSIVPSAFGEGSSGEIVVNGQRTEANYFLIDGVSANTGAANGYGGAVVWGGGFSGATPAETALGTTQSLISVDALEEFRATTSTYSAEYGRTPGGQFSFNTRAGTNVWHGSAFDYLRNGAMDANDWFNNYYGTPRQAMHQNDFGGTFGGRLFLPKLYDGRDKTFVFFSYEGLRVQSPQAAQTYAVPTVSVRQNAAAGYSQVLNAFPLPSANGTDYGDGLASFIGSYSDPGSINSSSLRVDHVINDRFSVFGRAYYSPSSFGSRYSDNPSILTPLEGKVKGITLGANNLFGSRFSNQLRFNLTANNQAQQYQFTNFGGAVPLNLGGLPGMTDLNSDWFIFTLFFETRAHVAYQPQSTNQRQINVVDTFNASLGRHNLKFGVDYRRLVTTETLPSTYEFGYVYDQTTLETEDVSSSVTEYKVPMKPVYQNLSLFAQDEWKVNPKLNVSLGLRWDLNPAPRDARGNNPYGITTSDLSTMQLAPQNASLWQTRYTNFAPRVGLAYQANQTPGCETVIRLGGGLFYDTGSATGSYGYNGPGFSSEGDFEGAFPLTQAQVDSVGAPSVAAPYSNTVMASDPHLKTPYSIQWNASLEQALGERQTFTLSYVASAGRQLTLQKVFEPQLFGNAAFSNGFGIYLTTNGASSDYNALQAQFQRRLSHGLQALVSYTWSHALDDVSSNFYVYEQLRADSDYDIRHNLQAALTYDLPGHVQNQFLGAALNHWSADLRLSARSALPLDIIGNSGIDAKTGAQINYHPNRIPGAPLYLHDAAAPGGRVINCAAFMLNCDPSNLPATEGNAGRNSARGFDAVQADAAIRREFPIREGRGLSFRAEAFNLFNHAIFGNIYNQLTSPTTFGYAYNMERSQLGGLNPLYQTGGPRSLQVALKLHF
ncbi:TonB-dependent receptor [Granulicella sp. S156]|uniref:TonB-dependent receptor n=1 Tax=Granulicella sp. S156 TaxID=1747224 RepID=UPI0020B11BAA|nr:TonB-dependent receptor [Granulicella sp. S156]